MNAIIYSCEYFEQVDINNGITVYNASDENLCIISTIKTIDKTKNLEKQQASHVTIIGSQAQHHILPKYHSISVHKVAFPITHKNWHERKATKPTQLRPGKKIYTINLKDVPPSINIDTETWWPNFSFSQH